MAFPSPSLAPPALSPWQLNYGGLTFGGVDPSSAYQLQSLTVDMPNVAGGDVQRAVDQGEFIGMDVLPGADITIQQVVVTVAPAVTPDSAAQALGGVMGPGGAVESPLWLCTPAGTFVRMCRPRKHNCPIDINRVFAKAVVATSMLHSTDPRWYAAPTQAQSIGLPGPPTGGLAVAPAAPWVLAAGSTGSLINVVNSGRFESRPVLIFNGPCINPVATNQSIAGAPSIGVNVTLNAGDQIIIDTDWQSVVLISAGSTIGSPRRDLLMTSTTWWNLPASSTSIVQFTSSDTTATGGTLTVWSASAYLTL